MEHYLSYFLILIRIPFYYYNMFYYVLDNKRGKIKVLIEKKKNQGESICKKNKKKELLETSSFHPLIWSHHIDFLSRHFSFIF